EAYVENSSGQGQPRPQNAAFRPGALPQQVRTRYFPAERGAATHKEEMSNRQGQDRRFGFGDNWLDFARDLDANQIAEAEKSVQSLLRREQLANLRFLDVGSGS